MKKYLIFAASALALASCSSDDFLGENPGNVQNATTAINFGGEAGKITRGTTSNEGKDYEKLGKEFMIYGVKSGTTAGSGYKDVFKNYILWYDDANKNTTTNINGWEYVGGSHGNQTIKFWDYSSADYHFVAGAPATAFQFNLGTENKIESATITGLGGHIEANTTETANTFNPVYVAEPKVVAKADYKNTVQFNFVRQQSMVRVGLYETIPGYKISEIHFYNYEGSDFKASTGKNIILTSSTADYFVGGSNVSGTVKYNWTATPSYTFEYDDDATSTCLTKSQNWYAGELKNGVEATTSAVSDIATLYGTETDMDATTGYFTVLPTPTTTTPSAILIKCDYTLTSIDGSGETIKVTGATAAIPAAFSKWEANTRYTYLFKISDNTNGTTGTTEDTPGLFPITFNAMVKEVEQGTTTTVATPSITTYQDGSVVGNTIEYKPDEPIYATVYDQATSELKDLTTSGDVEVYKLNKERTEAELQVTAIFNEEIKPENKITTASVPTTSTTVNNVTLDANKYLTFTPVAVGYYAIKYKYAADTYKYKVIKVVAPTVAP